MITCPHCKEPGLPYFPDEHGTYKCSECDSEYINNDGDMVSAYQYKGDEW